MASYQPQMPEARRGMPLWGKLLLSCGVLLIVGALAAGGLGYYFFSKITSEPGGVMGAAVRLANPDYEVLAVDEKERVIRVRHKKTGKEAVISFDQVREGAIDPSDVGLSKEEGGGNAQAVPGWLQYPGSNVLSKAGGGDAIQTTLETEDSGDKVVQYYETKLKENGYEVTSVSFTKTVTGKKQGGGSVTAQVLPFGGPKTHVLVVVE